MMYYNQFLLSLMQVAAGELLHSMVVYMVGKSAQMVEGKNTVPPMYKLHKRLFPVLLRLACDVDQVGTLNLDSYLDTVPSSHRTSYHSIEKDCNHVTGWLPNLLNKFSQLNCH